MLKGKARLCGYPKDSIAHVGAHYADCHEEAWLVARL